MRVAGRYIRKFWSGSPWGGVVNAVAIQEFLELTRRAKAVCESLPSSHDFEMQFGEVLDYLERHPELRSEFAQLFVKMLSDDSLGPWELICFCMYRMRWDEVRIAAARELFANDDHRVKAVMAHVIGSFSDAWEDADLYRRFARVRNDLIT